MRGMHRATRRSLPGTLRFRIPQANMVWQPTRSRRSINDCRTKNKHQRTRTQSSQEIFYEWSDSPRHHRREPRSTELIPTRRMPVPHLQKRRHKVTSTWTAVAPSSNQSHTNNGLVPTSSGYRNTNTSYSSTNYGSSSSSAQASSAYERSGASMSSRYIVPPSQQQHSCRAVPVSTKSRQRRQHQQHAASHTKRKHHVPSPQAKALILLTHVIRTLPAMVQDASQLKNEKRNDPNAFRASSLVFNGESSSGRASPSGSAAGDGHKRTSTRSSCRKSTQGATHGVEESKSVFFTGSAGNR